MGTVRYTVIDGEVVSELRGGVKRDYLPDPLGSTVALLDSSQAKTDTFEYWPYGESAGRTGTTATPFQYVGVIGSYSINFNTVYIRHRFLDKNKARWISEDKRGIYKDLYRYAKSSPISYIDPDGFKPSKYVGGWQNMLAAGLFQDQ